MKILFWLHHIGTLTMPRPQSYGLFHWIFILLSLSAGILLCLTHKKGNDARVRRVVVITSAIVLALEVYKMFLYHFVVEDGQFLFAFEWRVFPWQFCSIPMYAGCLTGIFKKGRIHHSLMAFLATFSVFGGLCVMAYPYDVFTTDISINIQTMICHGSLLMLGIYLYGSGYVKAEHKTILRAIPVFAVAVVIAAVLNEIVYQSGVLTGNQFFNMFFISPYFDCTLPVYSAVHNSVPFPWSLLIYIAGFSLAAYLMLLLAMGIKKLIRPRRKAPAEQA